MQLCDLLFQGMSKFLQLYDSIDYLFPGFLFQRDGTGRGTACPSREPSREDGWRGQGRRGCMFGPRTLGRTEFGALEVCDLRCVTRG